MSGTVRDLASAGLDQAIDLVDKSAEGSIEALNQVRGAVADVAASGVSTTDKVTEDLMLEIQALREKLISRLRAAKDAIVKPLEVLP